MAIDCRQFFINGEWLTMAGRPELPVINPATEQVHATLCLGTAEDVDLQRAPLSLPGLTPLTFNGLKSSTASSPASWNAQRNWRWL